MTSNNTTESVETFFENTGGGVGAPSASLKVVDDFVYGDIVDQAIVDKKKFASDEVEVDERTGKPRKQLVVILQTDLRNWQGVSKVPTNEDGSAKAASEDDGRRAVYVAPFTNIHAAIGAAVEDELGQKGPLANGGKLGVKIIELKDTGKGNPLKVHEAKYTAPSASDGFFGESAPSAQEAPAATPEPTPAAAPAAPQQQDPWAADAQAKQNAGAAQPGQTSKPPF